MLMYFRRMDDVVINLNMKHHHNRTKIDCVIVAVDR
jgi:hypothetical protein